MKFNLIQLLKSKFILFYFLNIYNNLLLRLYMYVRPFEQHNSYTYHYDKMIPILVVLYYNIYNLYIQLAYNN